MKSPYSTYLILLLATVLLGQMTASTYLSDTICGIESPVEESADEESDNELELDKLIQTTSIENIELSYSVSHHSFFDGNLSELIQEIVPPPPKA